jgi:hypothetical protein
MAFVPVHITTAGLAMEVGMKVLVMVFHQAVQAMINLLEVVFILAHVQITAMTVGPTRAAFLLIAPAAVVH